LESKGIDVIIGMDRLTKHKILIDYAKKSIKLTIPTGKKLEYVTELVIIAKGATNRVKQNQLDTSQGPKVLVVNAFLDVFPEELPSMPIDRDIEFVIELVSDIAPIYKRPYRMAALQLAELKDQIKELL
jgi:hypothetical protein